MKSTTTLFRAASDSGLKKPSTPILSSFKTGQGEKSIVYKCEPCLVSSPGSCTNRTRECAYCSSTSTDGGADCFEFTARCSYYQYERELRCDCAENYFVEDGACQPRREVFCSGFCLPGIVLGVTLLLS